MDFEEPGKPTWSNFRFLKSAFEIALIGAFIFSLGYLILTAFAVAMRRLRNQPEIIEDRSLYPTVTVQIPTYNELAALHCAARCLEFDYPRDKLQIMIGDDSNQPEVSAKIDAANAPTFYPAHCELDARGTASHSGH